MATTREELAKLSREVRRLKTQQSETQRVLRAHGLLPPAKTQRVAKHKLSERARD